MTLGSRVKAIQKQIESISILIVISHVRNCLEMSAIYFSDIAPRLLFNSSYD